MKMINEKVALRAVADRERTYRVVCHVSLEREEIRCG